MLAPGIEFERRDDDEDPERRAVEIVRREHFRAARKLVNKGHAPGSGTTGD